MLLRHAAASGTDEVPQRWGHSYTLCGLEITPTADGSADDTQLGGVFISERRLGFVRRTTKLTDVAAGERQNRHKGDVPGKGRFHLIELVLVQLLESLLWKRHPTVYLLAQFVGYDPTLPRLPRLPESPDQPFRAVALGQE